MGDMYNTHLNVESSWNTNFFTRVEGWRVGLCFRSVNVPFAHASNTEQDIYLTFGQNDLQYHVT